MPEIRPIKAYGMRILFRKMSLLMDGMDGSRLGRIVIEMVLVSGGSTFRRTVVQKN